MKIANYPVKSQALPGLPTVQPTFIRPALPFLPKFSAADRFEFSPGKNIVPLQRPPSYLRLPLGIGWVLGSISGWSRYGPMPVMITSRDLYREFKTVPTSDEVASYFSQAVTPYLGMVPKALLDTGLPGQEVLNALGTLAEVMRPLGMKLGGQSELTVQLGEKRLTLKKAGSGEYGRVYRMTIRSSDGTIEKEYALKSYTKGKKIRPIFKYHRHGKTAELGSSLFLSRWKCNDLARFHCGDLQAGWALYDWIDEKNSAARRSGRSAKMLLEKMGLEFTDDQDYQKNSLHGVRVDYGGIGPKQVIPPITTIQDVQTFASRVQDYMTRGQYTYDIEKLKEPLKKQAYAVLMNYADCWEQLYNTFPVAHRTSEYDALRAQTVQIFDRAVRDPEQQKEVARLLWFFPTVETQKNAFKTLLSTPGCWDSLEPALSLIRREDSAFYYQTLREAFEQGLQSPSTRLQAVSLYPYLSEPDQKALLGTLAANEDCLAMLFKNSPYSIPKEMRRPLFFNPKARADVMTEAVKNLQILPQEADRDAFFERAMAIPECQVEALTSVSSLSAEKQKAVKTTMPMLVNSILVRENPKLRLISLQI